MWSVIAIVVGAGAALILFARLRLVRARRLEEALPESSIGELEPGRYRVRGRVIPLETTRSEVDGADCVYIERAEYRRVGSGVPLLREVEHRAVTHPFLLDDDTGQVLIDPGRALIECARLSEDGGLTVERRLRAGEEVVLDATFAVADGEIDEPRGPYRASARRWRPTTDAAGPPRLRHLITDGALVGAPIDDVSGFLGGAGAIMIFMGALLAFVVGLIH